MWLVVVEDLPEAYVFECNTEDEANDVYNQKVIEFMHMRKGCCPDFGDGAKVYITRVMKKGEFKKGGKTNNE